VKKKDPFKGHDPFDAIRMVAAERGLEGADAEWLVNLATSIYEVSAEMGCEPLDFAHQVLDGEEGLLAAICHQTERAIGQKVGCRRGCVACCDYSVSVLGFEADRIAARVLTLPEDQRKQIVARTVEAVERGMDKLETLERLAKRFPCPLLIDGLCSVYEDRPIACRAWFGLSAEACGSLTESSPFGYLCLIGDTASIGTFVAHAIGRGEEPDPGGDLIALLADRLGIKPYAPPKTAEEVEDYLLAKGGAEGAAIVEKMRRLKDES
jgi:hypothetical protein